MSARLDVPKTSVSTKNMRFFVPMAIFIEAHDFSFKGF